MSLNLTVSLPEDWAVIPADAQSEAIDALLEPLAVDEEDRRVVREYVDAVAAVLRGAGVLALATVMHYDDDPPSFVQATCAWALHSLDPSADRPYEALVAASPFAGMDRAISPFPGKGGGDGARSLTFRRATEWTDDAGNWPYVLELRYAVPAVAGMAILLHFESLTVLYTEELEGLFDAIAATAAVMETPA